MALDLAARVAAEVRAEMARQRVTQETMAESLGWSQQKFSRRVTAEIAFDVAELERVAEILGVPLARFLEVAA